MKEFLEVIDKVFTLIPIAYLIWIERRITKIETVLFNHFGISKKKKK